MSKQNTRITRRTVGFLLLFTNLGTRFNESRLYRTSRNKGQTTQLLINKCEGNQDCHKPQMKTAEKQELQRLPGVPGGPAPLEAGRAPMGGAFSLSPAPWAGCKREGGAEADARTPFPRRWNTLDAGASQGSERGKRPARAGNPERAAGRPPSVRRESVLRGDPACSPGALS